MDHQQVNPEERELFSNAYQYFNARNIDAALQLMQPDVEWPNGMEGGYVHGHAGVREYWNRQWKLIDPHVEPVGLVKKEDGRVTVEVHQVIYDLSGKVLSDQMVFHTYQIKNGLIQQMEIQKD